jgi:hypothetical protein
VRVVSLCDLGLAEDLVGVAHYCVHPATAVAPIQKIEVRRTRVTAASSSSRLTSCS